MITNVQANTAIDEIANGIYRIHTPLTSLPGGFSFNQYLVVDEAPLLFHTGPRGMFPLVREAIEAVMPVNRLRYVAFSHYENDECGSLNLFLGAAPGSQPLCGRINALINSDAFDRSPHILIDRETLSLGERLIQWLDTPHLPHAWECGYIYEPKTKTLFCGDLFTQPGFGEMALTEVDILEPSEAMRKHLDYYAHSTNTRALLDGLAQLKPTTLACMHGSAWHGNGAAILCALADRLGV
jgi:flavorubredoxin